MKRFQLKQLSFDCVASSRRGLCPSFLRCKSAESTKSTKSRPNQSRISPESVPNLARISPKSRPNQSQLYLRYFADLHSQTPTSCDVGVEVEDADALGHPRRAEELLAAVKLDATDDAACAMPRGASQLRNLPQVRVLREYRQRAAAKHNTPNTQHLLGQRGIFSLPFRDWCPLWVYSLSPSAIGARCGYILFLPPRLVPVPASEPLQRTKKAQTGEDAPIRRLLSSWHPALCAYLWRGGSGNFVLRSALYYSRRHSRYPPCC
eukprot:1183407-Prorocentrum_minimum.AAC.3